MHDKSLPDPLVKRRERLRANADVYLSKLRSKCAQRKQIREQQRKLEAICERVAR